MTLILHHRSLARRSLGRARPAVVRAGRRRTAALARSDRGLRLSLVGFGRGAPGRRPLRARGPCDGDRMKRALARFDGLKASEKGTPRSC